ncbi:MAG: hypothetical protein V3W37_06480, partial [Candidatus Binatia bacterium]
WNSASGEQLYLGRVGIPRGKSSFIRFPKPKFNGKFKICLVRRSERKRDRKKGIGVNLTNFLNRLDSTYVEIQVDNDGSVSISLKPCQGQAARSPTGVTGTPLEHSSS